jgi:transcriptional regulator with XRE-family HTH domain
MPLIRELDSSAGPLNFFGAELRRWRMSAGLSQEQLGQRVGYSAAQVGKVETGDRASSLDFAQRCDGALPDAGGLFGRIYQLARRWDGGYPSWFRDWLEAEREASSLRWWEPMLVPGLLQTPDYARAILGGRPDPMEDELEQMVAARIERQAVLDRPRPPTLWVVLDEAVLHRCVGSPKIMHEQLLHLADLAGRPRITVQVVPARVGAHAGLLGAFIIAGFSGAPDIVYLETSADGQVSDKSSVVAQVTLRFDTLRAVALPRDDSRGLIVKVADGRWTPEAPSGARAVTAVTTAARA